MPDDPFDDGPLDVPVSHARPRRTDPAPRTYRAGRRRAAEELGRRHPLRRHDAPVVSADAGEQAAFEAGFTDALRDARRAYVPSVPAGAGDAGEELAGLLLGLVAFAMLRAWLAGGPSAVRAWLGAKLTNATPAAPGTGGPSALPSIPMPTPGSKPNPWLPPTYDGQTPIPVSVGP